MFTLSASRNRVQELFEQILEQLFPPQYCCLIENDEDREAFMRFQVSNYPDADPYHPKPDNYHGASKPISPAV